MHIRATRRCGLFVVTLFLVVFVGRADGIRLGQFLPSWLRRAESSETGVARPLRTTTTTGRQGAYYLPTRYEARALPLMVGFHGTGGKGSLMVLRLQALAEREGFIVLAPDSVSVAGVWMVGQRPGEVTEDYRHVMACVREVLATPGVRSDPARVLAVGFSVGGSVAPYLATYENVFTAFGILHGHVVLGSLGSRRPRVWLSAGDRDGVRTVEYMRSVADHLRQVGFLEVEQRVFRVDHTLQDEELTALVAWWLGRPVGRG